MEIYDIVKGLIASKKDFKYKVENGELIWEDNRKLPSEDKLLKFINNNKIIKNNKKNIKTLQESLNNTDWIVTKITEAQLEDEELAQELKEKYSDILTKRKEQRKEINILQGEIDELS